MLCAHTNYYTCNSCVALDWLKIILLLPGKRNWNMQNFWVQSFSQGKGGSGWESWALKQALGNQNIRAFCLQIAWYATHSLYHFPFLLASCSSWALKKDLAQASHVFPMSSAGCSCIPILFRAGAPSYLLWHPSTAIISAQTVFCSKYLPMDLFLSSLNGESRTGEMAQWLKHLSVSVSPGLWIQRHPKVFMLSWIPNQKG